MKNNTNWFDRSNKLANRLRIDNSSGGNPTLTNEHQAKQHINGTVETQNS